MKLDRARSGLTLLRNFRLVVSEPESTSLLLRYISRPKVKPGTTLIEYSPGLVHIHNFKPMRLTVV